MIIMFNFFKYPSFLSLAFILFALISCESSQEYQRKKIEKLKETPPVYEAIDFGAETLPASLPANIIAQRQSFNDMLEGFKDKCLGLIHVYHPSDIRTESLGICIMTHEQMTGIYQNNSCVVALIDHVYQQPKVFYSEKNLHWGIPKKCRHKTLLEKLKSKDMRTTVNPISYLNVKVHEDGFKYQWLQDRLNVKQKINLLLKEKMIND